MFSEWKVVLLCFFSNLRNPDQDSTPWCYIYRGNQVVWEFCSVPKCTQGSTFKKSGLDQQMGDYSDTDALFFFCHFSTEIYQECVKDSGRSYQGTKSVTKSGSRCLPWDIPELRRKLYNAWRPDALELGLGSHSFCRSALQHEQRWIITMVVQFLIRPPPCPPTGILIMM